MNKAIDVSSLDIPEQRTLIQVNTECVSKEVRQPFLVNKKKRITTTTTEIRLIITTTRGCYGISQLSRGCGRAKMYQ